MSLEEKQKQVEETINNNPLYVQMVYLSNDAHPCEPVPVGFKMESNEYPFVKDAPEHDDMVYDWKAFKWVDQDPSAQGARIAKLEEAQNKVIETVKDLKTATEEANKDNSELNKTLTSLQQSITASNQATAQQNAQLIEMISSLMGNVESKKEGEK